MLLCYIDESGTPNVGKDTSHYVLAGLSIPDHQWKTFHMGLEEAKRRYGLEQDEIHVAWMLRPYVEQYGVEGFESMAAGARREGAEAYRNTELRRLRQERPQQYKRTLKLYKKTRPYLHLAMEERRRAVMDIARLISESGDVRLFAECIDKAHFNPATAGKTVEEQTFEQLVSRFERYLQDAQAGYGLLIHDNNQTVARRHTNLMRSFLQRGTLWTQITHVIETPLFVDSQLTGMVQLADLCAYALRRYLENGEEDIFNLVFQRADRESAGVRLFTRPGCGCKICLSHNTSALPA